jgi:hypothetical protein
MQDLRPSTAASTRSFRRSSTNTPRGKNNWKPRLFKIIFRLAHKPQPTPSPTSPPTKTALPPPAQEPSSSKQLPQSCPQMHQRPPQQKLHRVLSNPPSGRTIASFFSQKSRPSYLYKLWKLVSDPRPCYSQWVRRQLYHRPQLWMVLPKCSCSPEGLQLSERG